MRYFNDTEKEVIDYICNASSNSDTCSVKKLFEGKCNCSMRWKNDYLTIYVANLSSAQVIVERILNIICLLDYLKTQGLIYIFGNLRETKTLINKKHGHTTMEEECDFIIPDDGETLPAINVEIEGKKSTLALNPIHLSKDISKKIFEYLNCTIFCSETLRHIKNQDYKDDETVQFEKNREQTKRAIRISLVIGVGSILMGVFVGGLTFCQNERHHRESMSQNKEIVIIRDSIIQISEPKIPTANFSIPDTLNVSFRLTPTHIDNGASR